MTDVLIVHASDLHFGAQFFPPAVVPTIHRPAGSLPPPPYHDAGALADFETEVRLLKSSDQPRWCALAVSGDLTANGDRSEFVQALSFVRQSVPISWKLRRGLENCFDEILCVPGDEDLAGGTAPMRGPNTARQTYFEDAPVPSCPAWFLHKRTVLPGMSLQICGLDSCGQNTARYGQGGAIDQGVLAALGAEITKANGNTPRMVHTTVRVLVLHHSPTHHRSAAVTQAGKAASELDPQARRDLDLFCRSAQIHFVLTGHTHEPLLPNSYNSFGTELRCGTTAAHYDPLQPGYGHTFLVHAITVNGRAVQWQTRTYQRSPRGGRFIRGGTLFQHQF